MTVWLRGQVPGFLGLDSTPRLYWVDGAGNRFVLVNCMGVADSDACIAAGPAWARACVVAQGPDARGQAPDGLVLLLPPQGQAQARMVLFNVDGSRPEACGNALRCLTRVAFDEGLVPGSRFVVETDAGDRHVDAMGLRAAQVSVSMGQPSLIDGALDLVVCGRSVSGVSISIGNPHFVVDLNSVEDADVAELGPGLATHPQFPRGSNVEFVFGTPDKPRVRVWERGVGETEACGSGACAVAHAMFGTALMGRELTLSLAGGDLIVGRNTHGLWLKGGARWESMQLGTCNAAGLGLGR